MKDLKTLLMVICVGVIALSVNGCATGQAGTGEGEPVVEDQIRELEQRIDQTAETAEEGKDCCDRLEKDVEEAVQAAERARQAAQEAEESAARADDAAEKSEAVFDKMMSK